MLEKLKYFTENNVQEKIFFPLFFCEIVIILRDTDMLVKQRQGNFFMNNFLASSAVSELASMGAVWDSICNLVSKLTYAITTHTQPNSMLITALIIIVFTGMIGGIVAQKLKQPLILGYILAGVFVGIVYKASFGAVANSSLDSLANIGVALLLFSMGLEFSKSDIRPIFKIAV